MQKYRASQNVVKCVFVKFLKSFIFLSTGQSKQCVNIFMKFIRVKSILVNVPVLIKQNLVSLLNKDSRIMFLQTF